jgi:hypothetical protein
MARKVATESKAYCDWVRSLPCCYCGAEDESDVHHAVGVGLSGMGMTASDLATMPLCRGCHGIIHTTLSDGAGAGASLAADQLRWIIATQDRAFREGVLVVAI